MRHLWLGDTPCAQSADPEKAHSMQVLQGISRANSVADHLITWSLAIQLWAVHRCSADYVQYCKSKIVNEQTTKCLRPTYVTKSLKITVISKLINNENEVFVLPITFELIFNSQQCNFAPYWGKNSTL